VAYHLDFITADELARLAHPLQKSGYGQYLLDLLRMGRAHERD
jgi:glucose-1-phosphate thymidylyltransferase